MKDETEQPCLHCEIVKMIREMHPTGIDKYDAHDILMVLARVAGDILGNDASGAAVNGFFEAVMLVRQTQPRELTFVNRSLN